MCQLMHGSDPIMLVEKSFLLDCGFQEAWQLLEPTDRGVPIPIGSEMVRLDKVFHNFGEIEYGETVQCTFSIKNEGKVPLTLAKPKASCSCTVTSLHEGIELAPGQDKVFTVALHGGKAISQRSTVLLSVHESITGTTEHITLELVASQRGLMEISPAILNFGNLGAGEYVEDADHHHEICVFRF